ncbi:MAG: hypothetical protein WC615_01515 [Mucilaginibacter sp.]|jgi:hypothetical protein|uniref:hypothetical protein n=1 Tax=Mucilaginibacter sp. TaxID=1882438 RepID=UPI003563A5F0
MKENQLSLKLYTESYPKENILKNILLLINMHKTGKLGGEIMPEDARPQIIKQESAENFHFLTLPMALNYQRNSYKLWESAAETFLDIETHDVFNPVLVKGMNQDELRYKLLKHKLALQPNKHINTWKTISDAVFDFFEGDVRNIFLRNNNDVIKIRVDLQSNYKKNFPYLSGHKIFNYWLYVIECYTPIKLSNRSEITVAPDTHIIQGSIKLGLISGSFDEFSQNRIAVSNAWREILEESNIAPIDIHTPLWLWSRRGFPVLE